MFLDVRMISHYILIVALSMKKKMTKRTLCGGGGGGGYGIFSDVIMLTTFISRGKELNTEAEVKLKKGAENKM